MIGTVGEICILIKFSSKREKLLDEIVDVDDDNTNMNQAISMNKLCLTRCTKRDKCLFKIIEVYDSLIKHC